MAAATDWTSSRRPTCAENRCWRLRRLHETRHGGTLRFDVPRPAGGKTAFLADGCVPPSRRLLWCRQEGAGHPEVGALVGTGIPHATAPCLAGALFHVRITCVSPRTSHEGAEHRAWFQAFAPMEELGRCVTGAASSYLRARVNGLIMPKSTLATSGYWAAATLKSGTTAHAITRRANAPSRVIWLGAVPEMWLINVLRSI